MRPPPASSPTAGILSAVLLMLDVKAGLHSKWSFLLFSLATAMAPRFMTAVGEDGKPLALTARVGTAVDTVGAAGRPKSITGFQTHTTPVLLGVRDRAELADDAYVALTGTIEGVVIVRANPDYVPAAGKKKPVAAAGGAGAGAAAK